VIERPRARRYPFAASIDLVEMESETETREQTTISRVWLPGESAKTFRAGTRVRRRILHRGEIFAALATS